LPDNPITEKGIAQLGAMPNLSSLRLHKTNVGDGLDVLVQFPKLKTIEVSRTKVTDAGMAALGRLRNLSTIHVNFVPIGDDGFASLLGLENLGWLYASGTNLTDKGLAKLAELPNLKSLEIRNTQVTAGGVAAFQARRPNCKVEWKEAAKGADVP
jgi:hypothetical protein